MLCQSCSHGVGRNTNVCFLCKAVRFVLTPLYWLTLDLTSLSMLTSSCWEVSQARTYCNSTNLLQRVDKLGEGFIRSILDFVPGKRPQVLIGWL